MSQAQHPEPEAEILSYDAGKADHAAGSGRRHGPRAGRAIAIGAAALLVAGVAGGGVYAANRLAGGGAQPADALPGDTIAYVALDLDPSAGQKVDFVRFLRSFPALRDRIAETDDPREKLFDLLAAEEPDLAGMTFARDVEPWLGDRIGLAVLPPEPARGNDGGGDAGPADEPEPGVAVAVQLRDGDDGDLDELRAFLRSAGGADQAEPVGVARLDDYAVLAEDQALADRYAQAASEDSLADAEGFTEDVEALDETGVALLWADLDAAGAAIRDAIPPGNAGDAESTRAVAEETLQGRLVSTLRFTGDDLEVLTVGSGLPDEGIYDGSAGTDLGSLPASTLAAVGIAEPGRAVEVAWARWSKQAGGDLPTGGLPAESELERELGLQWPEDLVTVLGSDLVVAVDAAGLPDEPRVAARASTDAEAADAVLDRLLTRFGSQLPPVGRARTADGVVVASTQEYADTVATGGDLARHPSFQAALPEAAGAELAVFVDVAGVSGVLRGPEGPGVDRSVLDVLDGVSAVGLTADVPEPGSVRVRLRVVTP